MTSTAANAFARMALDDLFARAGHRKTSPLPVYDDPLAEALLSPEESARPAGTDTAAAAAWAAFAEEKLENAARFGARQYLLPGASYDTLPYRQRSFFRNLTYWLVDGPAAAADRQARLARAAVAVPDNVRWVAGDPADSTWVRRLAGSPGFRRDVPSVCSLGGFARLLPETSLAALLLALATHLPTGSSLLLDHRSPGRMEALLSGAGFLTYEQLSPREITGQYFALHNLGEPEHPLAAASDVFFCLAVRK